VRFAGDGFGVTPVCALNRIDAAVEITSAWVHRYNTSRLIHRFGRVPPAEAVAAYYAATKAATPAAPHT
jgi:putative transposase